MHKATKIQKKATLSWCANLLAVLLLFLSTTCPAQRVIQYHHLLPLVNPAAMSESKATTVGLLGQYGLYGFDGAPQTVAMNATIPFGSDNSSSNRRGGRGAYRSYRREEAVKKSYIGVSTLGNRVGVHQNVSALAGYGHKVRLGTETFLTFAFTAGAQVQSSNYAKAANEYVTDPAILQRIQNNPTLTSFAWQVGAYLHGNSYYASLFTSSVPAQEYGYLIGWRSQRERGWNIDLSTLGIYHASSSKYQQDINFMLRYNNGLSVGASFRSKKDVAYMGSIRLGQLRIGYAYQIFNFDSLLPTHEILLRYTIMPKAED